MEVEFVMVKKMICCFLHQFHQLTEMNEHKGHKKYSGFLCVYLCLSLSFLDLPCEWLLLTGSSNKNLNPTVDVPYQQQTNQTC